MRVVDTTGNEHHLPDWYTWKVGYWFHSFPPTVDVDDSLTDTGLVFLAKYYANQRWSGNVTTTRHGAHPDMKMLPESVMRLSDERLKKFLSKLIDFGSRQVMHYSGAGPLNHTPELQLRTRHLECAEQYRFLFRRLGIRTRIAYLKAESRWMVRNVGINGFVAMEPLVKMCHSKVVKDKYAALISKIKSYGTYRKHVDGLIWDSVKSIEFDIPLSPGDNGEDPFDFRNGTVKDMTPKMYVSGKEEDDGKADLIFSENRG